MPFCKRIVRPVQLCRWSGEDRRLSALENLIDVSSFTLGSVLRQLSALAREAVSVLEEIELEIGSISHRALLLEVRIIGLHRYVSALALRPAVPSGSNLEQESKRTAHFKSLWQQNVNVFSSSSRPPCVEELHQEAQLNLQALLQEEFGEPIVQNEVAANTFGHKPVLNREAVPDSCPRKGEKRMEFVLMPSTRSSSEDETTTIGIRPQELFLNSPSTPEKPHKWIQPISPSTPEEKRWHHMRTTQVDLIPINVTGETLERHANTHQSLFNTETAMNPKSMLRRRRTVTGLHESNQPQQDISLNPAAKQKSPTGTQSGDIVVEDDDDVFISSGTQRSTEDLFTVIHRSKRKVLGWKEPGEVFNVRHVAVSPVKPPTTPPSSGLKVSPSASGNGIKVSTSNENFKALLQKKGSKPASGTRMSAAELLKSTNPLARRIATEFTQELERCQPILDPVSSEDTSKC
ncbi:NHS-like protein 2 isoform X4 [Hemiscyllium ocellatum]|uniref:NHS-like protein 2 isoform X4 n=1 Tax=Hemiscyllium ocellatum TaxID=170820 RepID=UPI0029660E2F|nr:NHS-like protein 2 isoform X4 [Hemiscyllium ocellatum]